jgi:hypothetical protein
MKERKRVSKINKVYFFSEKSGDYGGVYVAALNWKTARNIAITDPLILDHADNLITDVEGHICHEPYFSKGKQRKQYLTEFEGILSIQQICDVGVAWWECEECGGENLEIIDDGQKFKCRDCGFIDNVPYVS